MKIEVEIKIDRKTALLAGLALGDTEMVEIEKESFSGEQWKALVGMMEIKGEKNTLPLTAAANTGAAVKTALIERMDADAKKEAAAAAEIEARDKRDNEYLATLPDADSAEYKEEVKSVRKNSVTGEFEIGVGGGLTVVGYEAPGFSRGFMYPQSPIQREISARIQEIQARAKEMTLTSLEAATPALEKRLVEIEAEKEADRVAAAKAKAEKYAERLETGYYEEETGSYNERRYGAPWIAAVTWDGSKADYDFSAGESTGKWGSAGIRRIACKPGDFIARGQKDLRSGRGSDNEIGQMQADGRMKWFGSTAEAYKASKA